jgi:hypothetical protein
VRFILIVAALVGVGGLIYLANDRLRGDSTRGQPLNTPSSSQDATRAAVGFFITPSGRIACRWMTTPVAAVECGVSTGLHPPIPRGGSDCRRLPYVGNRIAIAATGKVRPIACAEGNGPFADPGSTVYLRYGDAWTTKHLTCRESVQGLTCRNRDGHGFFVSITHWFSF